MLRIQIADLLFASELLFTIFKSVALLSKRKTIRLKVAVPCFFMESLLGLALTVLLLVAAVRTPGVQFHLIAIGAVAILIAELLSILCEATNVWRKAQGQVPELKDCQWWRAIINWIASIAGALAPLTRLSSGQDSFTAGGGPSSEMWTYYVLFGLVILFATPSIFLFWKHHIRMAAALLFLIGGSMTAVVLSVALPRGNALVVLDFTQVEPISVFFLAAACGMSALAFSGLPDLIEHDLHIAHVRAFEVAAFSVTPPAIILMISNTYALQEHRKILFTVLPQVVAVMAPLLMSYLVSLFKSHDTDPVAEQSEKQSIQNSTAFSHSHSIPIPNPPPPYAPHAPDPTEEPSENQSIQNSAGFSDTYLNQNHHISPYPYPHHYPYTNRQV